MKISFDQLKKQLESILIRFNFPPEKASLCATIFAENSRDGVASHGVNRFPVFVQAVKDGLVNPDAEPEAISHTGVIQHWDGHLAPGMYTATLAMQQAVKLAREQGIGCVTVKNTNHWMRGGTYGWQAAEENCIAICATNTIANMPPWGTHIPRLGNNPFIIAIPGSNGQHIVLDMALSQFSYGKLQEYELRKQSLPVAGGYDADGNLTTNAEAIYQSKRILPIGFWKGSAFSMTLDMLVTALSGGHSVGHITESGQEYGLSQFFLCMDASGIDETVINDIIQYTKIDPGSSSHSPVRYPGESVYAIRQRSLKEGVEVNDLIWQQVLEL